MKVVSSQVVVRLELRRMCSLQRVGVLVERI